MDLVEEPLVSHAVLKLDFAAVGCLSRVSRGYAQAVASWEPQVRRSWLRRLVVRIPFQCWKTIRKPRPDNVNSWAPRLRGISADTPVLISS